ncbi:hypothetical protein ACDI16_10285 [Oceanobacillus caeni]
MENRKESIEKCIQLAKENLKQTIILNHKMSEFNKELKSMVGDK